MKNLDLAIEEATRATRVRLKHFIEPGEGTLRRATSRRHHIVFGRRGSGKSSLLRESAAHLTVDRRPIAFVDLEPFKSLSYPDLLLSGILRTDRTNAVIGQGSTLADVTYRVVSWTGAGHPDHRPTRGWLE
jgi:hypothetical protein